MFSFDNLPAVYKVIVIPNCFLRSVTCIVITIKWIFIEYIAGLHNIALTSQCALRDILY
jgi:hypothetical protein